MIVGTQAHIARLRSNPLVRALRVDKVTLALLAATLRLYANKESRESIPFFAMLAQSQEALGLRARRIAAVTPAAQVVDTEARVGGGSLPQARIPSAGIAVVGAQPDELAARLRSGTPPIVARIEQGRVLLDLRTVAPQHDDAIATALATACRA